MLQPILETLNKKNIILASGSPRRKEIMTALVSTADVDVLYKPPRLQSRAIAPPRFVTPQILAPPKYIMQQFSMHYPPIDMGNILVLGILKKRVYFPAYIININTCSS